MFCPPGAAEPQPAPEGVFVTEPGRVYVVRINMLSTVWERNRVSGEGGEAKTRPAS